MTITLAAIPATARADDTLKKIWAGFGDGRPYTHQVVLADAAVSVEVTILEGVAWTHFNEQAPTWIFVAPLSTLAGPIVHFAHGRVLAGIASLLGWLAVDTHELFMFIPTGVGYPSSSVVPLTLFLGVGGATAMLFVDALMSRSAR